MVESIGLSQTFNVIGSVSTSPLLVLSGMPSNRGTR